MRISDWSSDVCSSDLAMDGRSKAEVIGELAWHLWPAWESSEIGKALSEAIETRKPRTVRFRFASKHNSFWATARVKPWKRGAAIVIRDLSQDERDEINREQLGSRYNFTILAGSDIFWEWHVGDDRVVVNAAANNLIGGNEGSFDRNIGWWLDRVHRASCRERVWQSV